MSRRVQNSPRRPRQLTAARRSRLSKTRPRPRRTPHAGGRPQSFIPIAVVQRAAKLFGEYRRWSEVLCLLEREGNGKWARNTLIRRVQASTSPANVHNSDVDAGELGPAAAARGMSKTTPRRGGGAGGGRRARVINYPGSYDH